MSGIESLVNQGVILARPGNGTSGPRTFIVTGTQRSGTSMIAAILRQIGVFMGARINENVVEDEDIAEVLSREDLDGLRAIIRGRNETQGTWGFKLPMLDRDLGANAFSMFRDPHVILMFRDPAAVAVRGALSDYDEPMKRLREAVAEQAALVAFADRLRCPLLVLSYEKALAFPDVCVDAVLAFCGLPRHDLVRGRLVPLIVANKPGYIDEARRRFDGKIDGMDAGALCGWSRRTAADEPVVLELLADGRLVKQFVANVFRKDLRDAGLGTGAHAFVVKTEGLGLSPDTIIRVRVAKFGIELENSGRPFREYATDHA
jgi:hypothetical protein